MRGQNVMSHNDKATPVKDAARTLLNMKQLREKRAAETLAALQHAHARRAAAQTLTEMKHARSQSAPKCGPGKRRPNEKELQQGIPANFCVQEVPRLTGNIVDKYYYSPTGVKYRSILSVKKAIKAHAKLRTFVFDFNKKEHEWK